MGANKPCRARKCTSEKAKIEGKSTLKRPKIEQKSFQNRSWCVWGDPGRFGDAPGRGQDTPGAVQDAPGTAQGRFWDAPEHSKSAPGCSKSARRRSKNGPETVPGRPGVLVEPVRVAKRLRERPRIDFSRFRLGARKLRCAFCTTPASVLLISDVFHAGAPSQRKTSKNGTKIKENRCPGRPGGSPGDPKSSQSACVRAENAA